MSRKFNFIPHISDYAWVREQMAADLAYRMHERQAKTSLGRPLYYRINVWGESRYTSFRKKNIRDNANAKGFWAQAVPLKL